MELRAKENNNTHNKRATSFAYFHAFGSSLAMSFGGSSFPVEWGGGGGGGILNSSEIARNQNRSECVLGLRITLAGLSVVIYRWKR